MIRKASDFMRQFDITRDEALYVEGYADWFIESYPEVDVTDSLALYRRKCLLRPARGRLRPLVSQGWPTAMNSAPNPFIERTFQSVLRTLWLAAQVQR